MAVKEVPSTNNEELSSAIRETDLDNLIISIMDTADNLSTVFDEISEKVSDLEEYFKCDAIQSILNEYNEIKSNYNIIHDNIITYSDDLIDVKNNMKSGMKEIAHIVNIYTQEFQDKTREVK